MHRTPMVEALLKRCGVPYVHLTVRSPDYRYAQTSARISVLQHRNAGLRWVRKHCGCNTCRCDGVVYFGDDEDRYDLRFFDEVRFFLGFLAELTCNTM